MTDRELLELASKACGLEEAKMRIDFNQWNPLTDDGDALRLAVQLKMEVCVWDTVVTVLTPNNDISTLSEPANGDLLAATRRAITRAAAEIGRNMK